MRHVGEKLGLVLVGLCELAPLFLQLPEQARIVDRERRLGGEGAEELDGPGRELAGRLAGDDQRAEDAILAQQRHREDCLQAGAIQQRVREADLVLSLGDQLTDLNLGASKPQVRRNRSVWAVSQRVNVSFHTYTDVMLKDFVSKLTKEKLPKRREKIEYYDNLRRTPLKKEQTPLSINDMLVDIDHPILGPLRLVGSPVHLSDAPVKIRHAPPQLGQHTNEIVEEFGLASSVADKIAI